MDPVSQDSYGKRHKRSTIPTALVKEKEKNRNFYKKSEKNNRTNNNTYTGKPPQTKNDCGFCGQQNWKPLHKCPAKTAEGNKCFKLGHFARVCCSNTGNAINRINYIGETYNEEEEESEPKEIQQITQINRILTVKNDRYEIKMKNNGKYQKFSNDTGSPVTIMPNNRELYNQKDIQPLKERYQDVNENDIKLLGKNMGRF